MTIRGLRWFSLPATLEGNSGCTRGLLLVTAIYLGMGLLTFGAWCVTGDMAWIRSYFRIPGALVAVFLAGMQFWFSVRVLDHFSAGEPMRRVWQFIAASAAFDLTGSVATQILAQESMLNPVLHTAWWSADNAASLRQVGLLLGGTCRFTLLAVGLWLALRVYARNGLLGRLHTINWLALGALSLFVAAEIFDIVMVVRKGRVPFALAAGWPVDLLLLFLLAEAMRLYRTAQQMGPGWITRCWNALAVGVFLVALGDAAMWAGNWGYIPWPWSALEWYIWLPAAAAFALAPAYQLEAIQQAYGERENG